MDQIKIPKKEECFKLLKKYKTPPNIIKHSIIVNKISNYLAKKLRAVGEDVNLKLVDRASLLHDIGKYESIKRGKEKDHCDLAEKILKKEGYPEIGKIVKMHKLDRANKLKRWEEKIIYYADKRVMHRKIVNVRERYEDLMKRYKISKEKAFPIEPILKIEKEIFSRINESPDVIKKVIK